MKFTLVKCPFHIDDTKYLSDLEKEGVENPAIAIKFHLHQNGPLFDEDKNNWYNSMNIANNRYIHQITNYEIETKGGVDYLEFYHGTQLVHKVDITNICDGHSSDFPPIILGHKFTVKAVSYNPRSGRGKTCTIYIKGIKYLNPETNSIYLKGNQINCLDEVY